MVYQVIALRYRPRRFSEVVGQEETALTLKLAVEKGRLAHAYLFSGPRGVGKTSMARILAMALNCKDRQSGEPCGECESCRDIAAGVDLDVIELDGASNRGIDNIRELISSSACAPLRGKYKVYIVDEVHMLTREAFNAFLKTLEEPPEHVRFVLATTEPQRIPETVISRLQQFDFRPIGESVVVKRLRQICGKENVTIEDEVLERIAQYAHGGMRDAQTLLDQLITFAGDNPKLEDLERVSGRLDSDRLTTLIRALEDGNTQEVWRLTRDALSGVTSPEGILEQVLLEIRNRIGRSVERTGDVNDELLLRVEILSDAIGRIRMSPFPEIVVEICLLRLANCEGLVSIADLLDKASDSEQNCGIRRNDIKQPAPPLPSNRRLVLTSEKSGAPGKSGASEKSGAAGKSEGRVKSEAPGKSEITVKTGDPGQAGLGDKSKKTLETKQDLFKTICDLWQVVIDEVQKKSVRLGEFLRLSKPVSVSGNTIILEVKGRTSYTILKKRETKQLVKKVLTKVTGIEIEVQVRMNQKGASKIVGSTGNGIEQEPIYKKAMEIFGER